MYSALLITALACAPPAPPPPAAAPEAAPAPWQVHPDPAALGLDPAALDALVERAWASRTDALVVLKDREVVLQWPPDPKPIEAMSVTKSVVGLALVLALQEGAIASLDAPVSGWYPEWAEGPKAAITVRHLAEQTSGLAAPPTPEIYASPDFAQLALDLPLESPPGEVWAYNNAACNLLAALLGQAVGAPIDEYLGEGLFAELGITEFGWTRDAAGTPHGMSGLQLRATDLAALGQLVADGGRWGDRALLTPESVALLGAPGARSPDYGLLWWTLRPPCEAAPCPAVGLRADGYLGQHLVAMPEAGLVAARQMGWYRGAEARDTFTDFHLSIPGLLAD